MKPIVVDIGHKASVMTDKILAILPPDGAPVKAMRKEAKEQGRLLDATAGKTTRSVLFMVTGHVVLSSLNPETLDRRLARHHDQNRHGDDADRG